MPLNARIVKALVYWIAVVLLIGALSGCGPQSAQLPTYMRPELLYLNPQPYSRLYVEVDTIEGTEVTDQWLDELKSFLVKYCSKPDGIEIVSDEPVPISEIEGLPFGLASILCIDGPRPDIGQQPAYLHVFIYDTDLVFKQIKKNPHVSVFCPCSIFFNVDYAKRWHKFIITHETGHLLGLCKNTVHGDRAHCRNHGCLMCETPDLFSQIIALVVPPPDLHLCTDCQYEIEVSKSENIGSNLLFKGPFLIRRENGYSVASLPFCNFLIHESTEDKFDWRKALLHIKEGIKTFPKDSKKYLKSKKKGPNIWGLYLPNNKGALPMNTSEALSILTKATNDSCPVVRRNAAEGLEKLKQEQQ